MRTKSEHPERGAALVEMAIMTALFAIALLAASELLTDQTGSTIDTNADRIGTPAEISEDAVPLGP